MKSILHCVIFTVYLNLANSYSDYNDLRRNLLSFIQRLQPRKQLQTVDDNFANDVGFGKWVQEKEFFRSHLGNDQNNALEDQEDQDENELEDRNDIRKAREKALVLTKAKGKEAELNGMPEQTGGDFKNGKMRYHMDAVFNVLRSGNMRRSMSDSDTLSVSSSREFENFKEQFKDLWLQKKYEALNSTVPSGDQVNMVAARPWGVKCGDPKLHDIPWGTCMMNLECEPEYRIFRGDVYCGRTSFVCCALEATTYDLYQGFDVSFEDKSLSTDTEEFEKRKDKNYKNKKAIKDKKRRKDARARRKKKIKRKIKKIMFEINKILNRIYQNSSRQKKSRSRQMRKLIKKLKKEYKKNRLAIKDLHEEYLIRIDAALMRKINQIKELNNNFMKNATFASIVVNGTMTKEGARMLIQAYPELTTFVSETRRTSDGKNTGDYLDYDVEYGLLYY